MAENNYLRQVNTVPNFGVDLLFNAKDGEIPAGEVKTNHIIPKNKVIFGAIYRDSYNDLEATGDLLVKVGGVPVGSAVTGSSVKGTSVYSEPSEPVIVGNDGTVSLQTGGITAGDLDVVILYA